jgi:DNA repair protein RecO (recombination protein O)
MAMTGPNNAFNTAAILLRRLDYGDGDLILTVITPALGKLTLIAKAAQKSRRRFGGVLDLFAVLTLCCHNGRRGSLPIVCEANLCEPFEAIRHDMVKTAYASYWGELVHLWGEEGQAQPEVFHLFRHVLSVLDQDSLSPRWLSLLFQLRFMHLAGLGPHLGTCIDCGRKLDDIGAAGLMFDPARGTLVCARCGGPGGIEVSLGTVKQLVWIAQGELAKARRMRFSDSALNEGEAILEAFVPLHLGREPRSLQVLRQLRAAAPHAPWEENRR